MDIQKELESLKDSNLAIDWPKIKSVLLGISSSLDIVCDMLPAGIVKNIICGLASIVTVIANQLPV